MKSKMIDFKIKDSFFTKKPYTLLISEYGKLKWFYVGDFESEESAFNYLNNNLDALREGKIK